MFIHNLKYSFRVLFRNRALIFWTFAFPIILGTLFKMAFSDISNNEKLNIIDIAIVENEEFNNNSMYKMVFNNLSDENNKDRLFNTKYVDLEEAKELLVNDKIVGYLILEDDNPKIVVNNNGIGQTVLKYVTDEINSTGSIINDISTKMKDDDIDTTKIYLNVMKIINEDNTKISNKASSNLDYAMIEFYTLIAMTCMYGSILGITAINKTLPNMGKIGARVSITPTKKITTIISSILAGYLTQLIGLFILFIYTIFVLKVDYGSNIPYIILLALAGSFAGMALGVFIGVIIKVNENAKTGISIAVTMLGCFFAGMFGITEKYIIDTKLPIINMINPVNMITDGFYSLYYYTTYTRYWNNIISLIIFSTILLVISTLGLRRQRYDSI